MFKYERLIDREKWVLKGLVILYILIFFVNFVYGFIKGVIIGYYKNDGYELDDFPVLALFVHWGYTILLSIFLIGIIFCFFKIFKNSEYFLSKILGDGLLNKNIRSVSMIYRIQKIYIFFHVSLVIVKVFVMSLGRELGIFNYLFPDIGYFFLILLQILKLGKLKNILKAED